MDWTKILNKQKLLFLFLILILFSCKDKRADDKYAHIPFLHEIKGTKNYEVVELNGGPLVYYDSIGKYFLVEGSKMYYKYSLDGLIKDSIGIDKILMMEYPYIFNYLNQGYYTTWLENGDKTIHQFHRLFPEDYYATNYYKDNSEFQKAYYPILKNGIYTRKSGDTIWTKKDNRWFEINIKKKEIARKSLDLEYLDSAKYVNKHRELYKKASFVKYLGGSSYYKVGNEWQIISSYFMDTAYKEKFPEKLPPPRFKDIEIKRYPPEFVQQSYIVTQKPKSKSDALGSTNNFNMGTYIIRVGLPGGDSLIYKRLGDGLGNLSQFYQLPRFRGGNDSILFIHQDYHNSKMIDGGTYFSHGGLFMVRPKRNKN
ncbi:MULTISPECIES: hypothetical protein [Chryseobacterium]|uniref:hypothetical protein n=1 Tax=Chryseobacterium TaxID=59732 RepID=UPI001623FCF0|nr:MULTISPECIES: hypothetical protein [Chryseobacterium]MDM1554421.1 hypothetical protein [Chryseobacterium indologenes]